MAAAGARVRTSQGVVALHAIVSAVPATQSVGCAYAHASALAGNVAHGAVCARRSMAAAFTRTCEAA